LSEDIESDYKNCIKEYFAKTDYINNKSLI